MIFSNLCKVKIDVGLPRECSPCSSMKLDSLQKKEKMRGMGQS